MKVVEIKGGLGNQLFQYAFGESLKKKSSDEVKYDLSWFETGSDSGYDHDILYLDYFDVDYEAADENEVESIYPAKIVENYSNIPFHKKFPLVKQIVLNLCNYYTELDYSRPVMIGSGPIKFKYDPQIYQISGDAYFSGYWQAHQYVENVSEQLRQDLTVKNPPTGKNKKLLEKIRDTNAVSIHIRRGDYVRLDMELSIEYYAKAIEALESQIKNPHYYIFSDDIEWAKNKLSIDTETTYIDHNGVKTAYEDVRLMSACQHNIIANSTFSWWGAWLNENKNKVVIAPEIWVRRDTNKVDILPDAWSRVPNTGT